MITCANCHSCFVNGAFDSNIITIVSHNFHLSYKKQLFYIFKQQFIVIFCWNCGILAKERYFILIMRGAITMSQVQLYQKTVTIPTYEISSYDKNPMFLEKRVYQGSSGKIYPHPVCEGVSDVKTDKEYTAVFLENDYLLVMILPEIGGRIQRLYDKTNGYDAVYYNEVIKPALVGLAGPWISGGIEFNWPQHHRPSTFDPVDYTTEEHEDGSKTVWVGEIEKMFHTKGMAGFTLYPDKAYLEISGRIYNPTDRPQTFLWWANPAVSVNEYTRSIFPPDVHAVMDHGKRDVSTFPIATGTYYKVDYSAGVDISRYKNIPVPTSYMAHHSDFNFIGNYDDSRHAGLLHIADHHVSPGKKQWTWGNGDFGRAWDRNLTDENGPYIELMTGMFTDNQPDFTYLKPYEEKTFTQYFMPYKDAGAVKNASTEIVLNLEVQEDAVTYCLYSPGLTGEATAELLYEGQPVFSETVTLSPTKSCSRTIPVSGLPVKPEMLDETKLTLSVRQNHKELLSYTPVSKEPHKLPSAAEALPAPEEIETNEKLFLAAVHLEQYRHATRSPQAYYLEGLKRDPSDIRLNNGYGKWLYNKGLYAQSETYFRAAVNSSIWKNPNPYDCEPYYNLGLALRAQHKDDEAFDAFYKAVWDGSMQARAFYQLACIATEKGHLAEALQYVENSLVYGLHNLKARSLKTTLLRLTGQTEKALAFAQETMEIDPLDHGCRYEQYCLTSDSAILTELKEIMRDDPHNYIELALNYRAAGLSEQAAQVLRLAGQENSPLLHYYLYACTDESSELTKAENADSLYCFPNRLEDMEVLQYALKNGGVYAGYYLGCLLYDRGRFDEAVTLWEDCAGKLSLPTVYRNLSLAYYNKTQEPMRAKEALEKAFSMDTSDARVFFELDQLYKMLNFSPEKRLEHLQSHIELLEKRDDLYTEYITLLNLNGEYQKAYDCIMNHTFHPWEGGEGKIPAQYRIALINLARKAEPEQAVSLLKQALVYPYNLGEGKLIGATDNDIYYLLGTLLADSEDSRQAFSMAVRGTQELSSAMYYNDQPPEMMYYAALAQKALGNQKEADRRFDALITYGDSHMEDEVSIDYFAVSLPDFLIFDADLTKKNKVHCCCMAALGHLGKGNTELALSYAKKGLEMDACHLVLNDIQKGILCR
jgi:tetratricopeptide (TPR) repeat protein